MGKKIVDTRGHLCPKPLIMTKKALTEMSNNDELTVILDNDISRQNVFRFLIDNGISVTASEENGIFYLTTGTRPAHLQNTNRESYCKSDIGAPNVIVISSTTMGKGSDELGEILIKAFINTIKDIAPLPGAIVFYNSGIHLATDTSPVLDSLRHLESLNVKILVCGTCVDYYGKKDNIKVGTISNMYTIMEMLSSSRSVIYP